MSTAGAQSRSTREAILDAALDLFAEQGAGEIRLEDIAKRARVSRQSVYVHFGSRAGLLMTLIQHVDSDGVLEHLIQRVLEAPSALDALDAVVHLHAEYSPLVYPVAKVFMARRHDDEALRMAWDDRMEGRRNLYREVIERLEGEGLLASEWDAALAMDITWALMSWQVWEQLVIDQGWTKANYLRHLRTTLRRTLVEQRA